MDYRGQTRDNHGASGQEEDIGRRREWLRRPEPVLIRVEDEIGDDQHAEPGGN